MVEPSQATRKRLPRTVTRPAMASTCNGSLRSIYHQKKTDRHEFRHAREKPTARMACHRAATAQMTNKPVTCTNLTLTTETTTSPAHPFAHDEQHHHLVHPNHAPPSSAVAVYQLFIYYCFLFQIHLNRSLSAVLESNCFFRFWGHSKLIILIKCKCLKILFSPTACTARSS